jgi:hypothetical protein
MMHPKKSHLPMLKGMMKQSWTVLGQELKIVLAQPFVVIMVTAVKTSET